MRLDLAVPAWLKSSCGRHGLGHPDQTTDTTEWATEYTRDPTSAHKVGSQAPRLPRYV